MTASAIKGKLLCNEEKKTKFPTPLEGNEGNAHCLINFVSNSRNLMLAL